MYTKQIIKKIMRYNNEFDDNRQGICLQDLFNLL